MTYCSSLTIQATKFLQFLRKIYTFFSFNWIVLHYCHARKLFVTYSLQWIWMYFFKSKDIEVILCYSVLPLLKFVVYCTHQQQIFFFGNFFSCCLIFLFPLSSSLSNILDFHNTKCLRSLVRSGEYKLQMIFQSHFIIFFWNKCGSFSFISLKKITRMTRVDVD